MKLLNTFIALLFCVTCFAQEPEYNHVFFDNSLMSGSYFYSKADYISPSFIQTIEKKLPVCDKEFFTAKNSLLFNYVSAPNGKWSATVIYRDWRGKEFIKEGSALDFKMRITSNTTFDELPLVAIAKKSEASDAPTTADGVGYEIILDTIGNAQTSAPIHLKEYITQIDNSNWYQVRIPLSQFKGITYNHTKEIKQVIFSQGSQDGKEHTIYIDQIELLPINIQTTTNNTPPVITAKPYERHVDIKWNKQDIDTSVKYISILRAEENGEYKQVGIQDPKVGYFSDYVYEPNKTYSYKAACLDYNYQQSPFSNTVVATTYNMTDDQLLDMVQEASFRYYWDGAEEISGLAYENIPGRQKMIASGASGFGLIGITTAVERGFITREQAVERLKKIVRFLDKTETYHGAFSHFIDADKRKAEPFFGSKDNGGDLVETAFLFEGLLTARQYFDRDTKDEAEIRNTITKLWHNVEWDWYKQTKDSKYIYWHWSPDQGFVINHPFIGWNEAMIVYLLAIASPTHGVSKDMYYSGWASQDKIAQDYRAGWGQTGDGKMYSNGNAYQGIKLDVGVNSGGPLFFIQFSYMGFDPRGIKDKYTTKDYFDNFRNIALISYRYSIENPKKQKGYGADCWGLSACEDPWGYGAFEAMPHGDRGTMSPAGAIGSFPYTPEQSMAALKNYYRNYGSFLWGEYGFRDSFNFNENWCSNIYMGLNQAAIVNMIENHRSALPWKLFMQDPDIQKMKNQVFMK